MNYHTPPITQLGGVVVIQTPAMLAAAYRAVLAGIARRRLDGSSSHDLQPLARALGRAHIDATSLERHELVTAVTTQPCCECQGASAWLSVGDAAALLRLSRRQVQRMAADQRGGLDAIRIGRTWLLNRATALALAERRERDRTGRQLSGVLDPARPATAGWPIG